MSNKKVMIRVQTELQTELHFTKDMIKRKLEYARHMLSGLMVCHIYRYSRARWRRKKWVVYKNMDE